MADDPFVRWLQSVPFGIYRDGDWDPSADGEWSAWHSGRVKDVLRFPDDSVLIAAEHGGLWRSPADGRSALGVTDGIAAHRFNRLAFGPDGDSHVFAGGESLWVTDPSDPVPMLAWQQITSFLYGTVWDILVLGRTIIVAAEGIWWADIPQPQPKRGCLGALFGGPPPAPASYVWKRALIDTPGGHVPTAAFYSLAEGRADRRNSDRGRYRTVIAGSAGTRGQQGIFLGGWDGGDLVFGGPSQILIDGTDATARFVGTGRIEVASCIWDTDRAYAAADRSSKLDLLLRSTDGGRTWTLCGSGVPLDTTTGDLFGRCDHQAGHQTLHVFPADADVVAFGWFDSYVSFDGGDEWVAPGCDDKFVYQDNHQHVDVHRVVLPPPPDAPGMTPPRTMLVAGDGATNRITWAHGVSFIEGQFKSDSNHGDLEAVVLEGNDLVHYRRPSKDLQWAKYDTVTSRATDRACIIQGDFGAGSVKNFELVVPEGGELVHYFHDNSGDLRWHRGQIVASGITGPACLIQSNYPRGAGHGNFEVLALEGSALVHYFHDNADVNNPWQRGVTISSHAESGACMIQSDYPKDADHGNFEVVLLEDDGGAFGRALVHYWRDNGGNQAWNGPTLITKDATAASWLFQSDYPRGVDHHNFELFVQHGVELWHWIRDNQAGGLPWLPVTRITAPDEKIDGPAVAFQGNYGSDDHHGNFELLAPFGGRVFHYWRDDADPAKFWHRSAQVSRYAFHYFTRWNRNTPTLMCNRFTDIGLGHGQLGVSQAVDGMLGNGLQDNGVVAAISGESGTPWVEVGGGDGNEAVWPAANSPAFDEISGGGLLVWTNDADGGAPKGSVGDPNGGMKAASPQIIPLNVPDPTVLPAPDPAVGLTGDPRIGRVVAPQYVDQSRVLSLLGAPAVAKGVARAAVYGLFIDGMSRSQRNPPKAGWQFLAAVDIAAPTATRDWPIRAIASLDGASVMMTAAVAPNSRSPDTHTELLLLDVQGSTVTWMNTDPAVGFPAINWIVPVSSREAYAVTGDGRVLVWNGIQWQFPGSVVTGGGSLGGLAVDPATRPATVFVITDDTVSVSRDGTRTWRAAMRGLPRSLECSNIQLMTHHQGVSRLHLSTYGRSTWVADRIEPG